MSDDAAKQEDITEALERALRTAGSGRYKLRLYVSGATRRSGRAIERIKQLCEKHLPGRYDLEVVDVFQNPVVAIEGHIVATPTLVKEVPPPLRRLIGDLHDEQQVLKALDIRVSGGPTGTETPDEPKTS